MQNQKKSWLVGFSCVTASRELVGHLALECSSFPFSPATTCAHKSSISSGFSNPPHGGMLFLPFVTELTKRECRCRRPHKCENPSNCNRTFHSIGSRKEILSVFFPSFFKSSGVCAHAEVITKNKAAMATINRFMNSAPGLLLTKAPSKGVSSHTFPLTGEVEIISRSA